MENERLAFEEKLDRALQVEIPYTLRTERDFLESRGVKAIPSAVLVLFGFSDQGEAHLLLTKRTETVETHKGQMAFPGGLCEPEDKEDPIGTALRETQEEVGIDAEDVQVKGILPSLITSTGYSIQPVVAVLRVSIERVMTYASPDEISEILWIPLKTLMKSDVYRRELFRQGNVDYPIDVFLVDHYRIWGATGSMTKNILDRLISLG